MIERLFKRLVRLKNDLKGVDTPTDVEVVGGEDVDDFVDDGEPLTWAEQKGIRRELRRFQLWHALRLKVPRGFEEGV